MKPNNNNRLMGFAIALPILRIIRWIYLEDSLTAVEQILAEAEQSDRTIKQLHTTISQVVKTKIKVLIEEILSVEVKDLLFDTTIKTKRTGAIATLSQSPLVRNPESIPKNKNYQ